MKSVLFAMSVVVAFLAGALAAGCNGTEPPDTLTEDELLRTIADAVLVMVESGQFPVVRAQAFEVVDEHGRVVTYIEPDLIDMRDSETMAQVCRIATMTRGAKFSLGESDRHLTMIQMQTIGNRPEIELRGPHVDPQIALTVLDYGQPGVAIRDNAGDLIWSAP